jgi:hypothetical protein
VCCPSGNRKSRSDDGLIGNDDEANCVHRDWAFDRNTKTSYDASEKED